MSLGFFWRSLSWICELGKLEALPIGKQNHLDTLTMHISVGKLSSAVANQWKLFGEIVREIRRISRFCSPLINWNVSWHDTNQTPVICGVTKNATGLMIVWMTASFLGECWNTERGLLSIKFTFGNQAIKQSWKFLFFKSLNGRMLIIRNKCLGSVANSKVTQLWTPMIYFKDNKRLWLGQIF